ncbi:MAG: methylenetetrahydrofolate reductase C-terminal domain-containing protein [Dehalococcoidales bacterium]|nr:methylenetetrahydrofolate reductase C-terminal domain-containing protein [Dehalococcoidales bacterium]
MIVTTQKPLDEVLSFISPYSDILITGCDGCTQPPRGLREAKTLAQFLELAGRLKNKGFNFKVTTVAKQCDNYLAAAILKPQMGGVAAVLSLACGIGVQTLAGIFSEIPVFPAQNTHFMGAEERESGILEERCAGCGDCLLAETGGICPVARCSKGLLSGACGGSKDGKCELSSDRDCAWCLIYERLKEQGKLALLKKSRPPRDYQLSGWRVTT